MCLRDVSPYVAASAFEQADSEGGEDGRAEVEEEAGQVGQAKDACDQAGEARCELFVRTASRHAMAYIVAV